MFTAYLIVLSLTAFANAFSAALDFIRYQPVLVAMAKANVSASWLPTLGLLKAAGAAGLLLGLAFPPLAIAASVGLTLFFLAAVSLHLRSHDYSPDSFGLAVIFLSLAFTTLTLRLILA